MQEQKRTVEEAPLLGGGRCRERDRNHIFYGGSKKKGREFLTDRLAYGHVRKGKGKYAVG